MPEEINRLVTDAIADVLWTPSKDADDNLLAEGVDGGKIDRIGNIMIDSFEMLRNAIETANTRDRLGLTAGDYALVTLHRPSEGDALGTFKPIVDALVDVSDELPVVFVTHPRTIKGLEQFDLAKRLSENANIILLEPLPYIQFMNVVTGARLVITDSGGLQEETTYLGIPCLTLRENTERPITVSMGTNKLVNATTLAEHLQAILRGDWPTGQCPPLWDGKAATRAVECLRQRAHGNN